MLWRRPHLHGSPLFIDSSHAYQSPESISWPRLSVTEVVAGTYEVSLGIGDAMANLVVHESLDDILPVSAHYYAAHVRVVWLGPEIPRVNGVAADFERNEVGLSRSRPCCRNAPRTGSYRPFLWLG
jgi:hypothetical protein